MLIFLKPKLIFLLVSISIITGAYFYFVLKPQNEPTESANEEFSALRCPDEYTNGQDRIKAFDMFVSGFFEVNPGATYADLALARHDFYVEFNCTEALSRESDYRNGNLDPETKQAIERVVDETLKP